MSVLVTGGCGYIGSHIVLALRDRGERAVVIDNLSTGHRNAIPPGTAFVEGDVGDAELVEDLTRTHGIDAVIHLAGSSVVSESVQNPAAYYLNNAVNTHTLAASLLRCGVKRFIFSSTAAVYGAPDNLVISEDAPLWPASPYGVSKLLAERLLRDIAASSDMSLAVLRYFNVAGADPFVRAGQTSRRSTHLIKACLDAALGHSAGVDIYGDDYATPDGTGVRDYIHVSDLADAHVLCLERLRRSPGQVLYNCGYGTGYSVREVISAVKRISGLDFPVRVVGRRPGDVGATVANPDRLKRELGWAPRHASLDAIIEHALAWEHRSRPGSMTGPQISAESGQSF